MNIVLAVLMVLAALACLLVSAMAGELHGSDPAGNGLAQAYMVLTLGCTWVLLAAVGVIVLLHAPAANVPVDLPWRMIGVVGVALFALAAVAQFTGAIWLFDATDRGAWRTAIRVAMVAVPLAFLFFAAWRGLGLPLSPSAALGGCGAIMVLGSLVPFGAHAFASASTVDPDVVTVYTVTYPALLLDGERSVRVLRSAADLQQALPEGTRPDERLLVDANGASYSLSDPSTFTRSGPMAFDRLRERLQRIPSLSPDPVRDAEIRRLIDRQRDVTALTFVLER